MICVMTGRVIRGNIDEKIIRWETWFNTPFGHCQSLQEAVQLMKDHDIDARMAVAPVAVAITGTSFEVWSR